MLVIVYTRPEDGGLSVVYPAFGWPLETVAEKAVPPGVPFRIINTSELPPDRVPENRHAWTDTGTRIVVDPVKVAAFRKAKADARRAELQVLASELDAIRDPG